jgi:two-component system chemotaxis response regulator CheY
MKVLIVDDSITITRILQALFDDLGHEVVDTASNATEAMELYIKHKPDLITLDISMPNVSGIELANFIKKLYPEAKIIMVTAEGGREKVKEALKQGASGFVLKPITKEKLQKSIEKVFKTQ